MHNKRQLWARLLSVGTLILLLEACVSAATPENEQHVRLPNPAVAKCVTDGWQTEPVLTNGVPSGTVCINPKSGQRCEAWAYFRGECPAANSAPQHLNPSQKTQ